MKFDGVPDLILERWARSVARDVLDLWDAPDTVVAYLEADHVVKRCQAYQAAMATPIPSSASAAAARAAAIDACADMPAIVKAWHAAWSARWAVAGLFAVKAGLTNDRGWESARGLAWRQCETAQRNQLRRLLGIPPVDTATPG